MRTVMPSQTCLLVFVTVVVCFYWSIYITGQHDLAISNNGVQILDSSNRTEAMARLRAKETFGKCVPHSEIFYLKTYKTGSSTLTSLFYRFAWRANRTIVPVSQDPFPFTMLPTFIFRFNKTGKFNDTFDMLAEHLTYNATAVGRLFKKTPVKVLSLRYPLAQFKSSFREFGLQGVFKINASDPVAFFLSNIARYSNLTKENKFAKNVMAVQLGLSRNHMTNVTAIDDLISRTEQEFDLIVMAEYFDESLVLLRRKLCWQLRDVIYVKLRQRKYPYKTAIYNQTLLDAHKGFSMADYKIYNHFHSQFLKELSSQSQDFVDEVYHLRQILSQVEDFCSVVYEHISQNGQRLYDLLQNDSAAQDEMAMTFDPSPWGEGFKVTAVDCAIMRLDTTVLRNLLKVRQNPQICHPSTPKTFITAMGRPIGRMKNGTIALNKVYCSPWSQYYNFPIELLTIKGALENVR